MQLLIGFRGWLQIRGKHHGDLHRERLAVGGAEHAAGPRAALHGHRQRHNDRGHRRAAKLYRLLQQQNLLL